MKVQAYETMVDRGFKFYCPGCQTNHTVRVEGPEPRWTFNGDVDRPTFSPSILVRSGHYHPSHRPGDRCWCAGAKENLKYPPGFKCERCHSFVRDGKIQFLDDCTHALAGQTVDMPDRSLRSM